MTGGRVVVDLVAPQSPSYRERGIARHGLDFANAVVDRHSELIDRVLLHPELPPAGGLEHLIDSGKAATDLEGLAPGGVFHVTSAFEPEVPIRRLWPRKVSALRMRLVVTVYDLIPDIFPDLYLVDPGLRRRWRACRELARVADHVLVLSESGADDVVRMLGVPRQRVSVIGAGCHARFHPPESVAAALGAARAAIPGLGERFVVYNGAIDPRKNLDRLVQAYAALPVAVRDRWQLVLVCRADPLQANHYRVMAERLGAGGRVLLPGYVSDEALVALYQSTDLSVFPSLYEGYGLPVVEAQACGARVVAADNSSLVELVDKEARFDGTDVSAIATAMERGLTDDRFRAKLAEQARRPPPDWADVADRAAAVYQRLLDRDRGRSLTPGWAHELRVAVVSPLPGPGYEEVGSADGPAESGIAGSGSPNGTGQDSRPASAGYLEAAAAFGEALAGAFEAAGVGVDRFADGLPSPQPGKPARLQPATLGLMDGWRAGYDLVVCCVGDDPAHLGALAVLRRPDAHELPLVVIAHQVRLGRLYEAAAQNGELGFDVPAILREIYPGLPREVGAGGLDAATVSRHGLVLAREVIGAGRRYLVSSEADARLARIDARPGEADRVQLAPELSLSTFSKGRGLENLASALLSEARAGQATSKMGRQ
jgi:glycosyltransferase involved in cell wall biosynthesis